MDHEHNHTVHVKKVDKLSETRVRLAVEVPQEAVQSHVQSTAHQYQQKASIPGFRPGKAPLTVVQTKYKAQIEQDVVSHLLEAGLHEAVKEAKLMPINRPRVEIKSSGFDGKSGLVFEAEYEVRPEIKLKDYKGIKLTEKSLDVPDKEINDSLTQLRDRMATLEPSDAKKAEKGMFAVAKIAIEMLDGDKKKEEAKEYTLELGADQLLPDLEKALLQTEVGGKKEISSKFPADYSDKGLAGRPVKFNIEVLELKKKNLPALDDDFARQLTNGKDLATLKEELKKDLVENKRREQKDEQRKQILDHLIAKHNFEVPASMVAQRMKDLVEQVTADMKRRGQAFPEVSEDEVKILKQQAERQVKGSLLLAELSMKEKIEVDPKQVDERVSQVATQLNKPPEEARKWLEGKGYLTQIREEVLTDQLFAYLAEHASSKKA